MTGPGAQPDRKPQLLAHSAHAPTTSPPAAEAHVPPPTSAPASAAALPPQEAAPRFAGRLWRTLAGDSRGFVLRRLLALSDLAALFLALGLTTAAMALVGREPILIKQSPLFAAFLPVWFLIAVPSGLYHLGDRRLGHSIADEFGPIALGLTLWSWAFLLSRAVYTTGPVEFTPSVALWVFALFTVPALRALTRSFSRRCKWYRQRVAIVGTAEDARRVARRLRRHPELGLELATVIEFEAAANGDEPLGVPPEPASAANGSGDGLATALVAAAGRAGVNRVVLASAPVDLHERSELIRTLSELHVHVDVVSADADAIPSRGSLHYIEGLPIVTVSAMRRTRTWTAIKRGFDLAAASAGMVVLAPMLAYYAVRIRLDSPGPALFRQRRVGRGGREFEMVKLRTMVNGAHERRGELAAHNFHNRTETPGMFKANPDPRVTKLGCKLRRWSIDELPQLWNVLRGEMSLVGPRPLVRDEAELVRGHYEARFGARPGITGPWQTEGRSEIGFEDMLKLDYTYVRNWSLSEDLKLLLRTVGAVIRRRGAY